jgi:hypothetical protein
MSPGEEDATTRVLVSGVGSTACASCGTPMASDQRYCVNCGARRGGPRFPVEPLAPSGDRAPAPAPAVPSGAQSRWGGATAVIAGIGTLLLAMGVGVLVGHNTQSDGATRAAPPQVITVGGGAANAATTTTSPTGTTAEQSKSSSKKPKTAVVHVTPKVSKAAAGAASKTLGGSAPKNPTVNSGDSCKQGDAGCGKDGKFDGSFFGP